MPKVGIHQSPMHMKASQPHREGSTWQGQAAGPYTGLLAFKGMAETGSITSSKDLPCPGTLKKRFNRPYM